MRKLLIFTAIALGSGLAVPAMASEAVPRELAQRLDKATVAYSWSAAAERRHMIIEETMRQQRYGRGYGYGRGYSPPRGYGPPPGYGYGYGRGPGWGPPRYAPPPPDWW